MIIKEASFIKSSESISQCPAPDKPEYAFIGRSNVGKSSLINMITNRKGLAKISSKPGKTRLINHFFIDDTWYLVDLPGYGYAKVSKTDRKKWESLIRSYLLQRENLYCVFVLIDIRHKPQQIDLDFMEWLGLNQVPFVIVFTKADKLKENQIDQFVKEYVNEMLKSWAETPQMFVSAATTSLGKTDLLKFIKQVNKAQ